MGLKGKGKTGRDFYKEDEKGLSTDWKEAKENENKERQLMCPGEKNKRQGEARHMYFQPWN